MEIDIVTRAENGAPLSIERLDANFSNAREALEDLYVKFGAGIRITTLTATSDGAGLVMNMSDGTILGPIPFPMATSRLRGEWLGGGTAYQLRDQVYVPGVGSAVALVPHESGETFDDDFAISRWQMVAADGQDGEGGDGTGSGKVLLSMHRPGAITLASVDDPRMMMIPVAAVGLGDGVLWNIKLLAPPGVGESLDWEISHVSDTGALAIAWGTISDTNTSATTWVGDVAEFAAGDMLAVTITAASAGCAATDLVVGIALGEA